MESYYYLYQYLDDPNQENEKIWLNHLKDLEKFKIIFQNF